MKINIVIQLRKPKCRPCANLQGFLNIRWEQFLGIPFMHSNSVPEETVCIKSIIGLCLRALKKRHVKLICRFSEAQSCSAIFSINMSLLPELKAQQFLST